MVYHRWLNGGAGDDTVVVINFSDRQFDEYELEFSAQRHLAAALSSVWQGYDKEFKDTMVPAVQAGEHGEAAIVLPPSTALIFRKTHAGSLASTFLRRAFGDKVTPDPCW